MSNTDLDYLYVSTDTKSFYKYLCEANFSELTKERVEELRKQVPLVKNRVITMHIEDYKGARKYMSLMNHIKMNPKRYGIKTKAEMYIFFMFVVDPEFDALVIHESSIKHCEIRDKMSKKFGLTDLNLIRIEKIFYSWMVRQKEHQKVKEKIEAATWK